MFVLFYVGLIISLVVVYVHIDNSFSHLESVDVVPIPITEFQFEKTVDVSKEKLFNTMSNVEDYPKILPKNVISTDIIERNSNEILANEELVERGIRGNFLVQHTLTPYEQQVIEVMDGDASGTKITIDFEEVGNSTKISVKTELKLRGILTSISFIPKPNLSHAMDTVISGFVTYAQGFDSPYEKTVDDLYREILFRPADPEGLEHYSQMLESGKLTKSQLRDILLASDERTKLLPQELKNVDELNDDTKLILQSIYRDMLNREPDETALKYYGSLLETGKITPQEIRAQIFDSEEGLAVRLEQPGASAVDGIFMEMFDRHATQEELDKYAPLIHSRNMTRFELMDTLNSLGTE